MIHAVEGVRRAGAALTIAVCVLVGACSVGMGTAVLPDVYEADAVVRLTPIDAAAAFDDDPPLVPSAALARELAAARSVHPEIGVERRDETEVEVRVSIAVPDALRFVARSDNPDLAAVAAVSYALAYVEQRDAAALAAADDAVAAAERRLARAEDRGSGVDDAERALEEVETARAEVESGTAALLGDVTRPCCPVGTDPSVGIVVGMGLGALAGVLLVRAGRRGLRLWPARDAAIVSAPPVLASLRTPLLVLAGLTVARALVYALLGVNLVLDDWTLASNAELHGFGGVVPDGQDLDAARPGAWLAFTLLYGTVGAHPLALLVVVTAVNVAVAGALLVALDRFLDRRTAVLVALLWVLLPTHTTLAAWPGTTQVIIGFGLFLVGVWATSRGRWAAGGLLLAASILCYELVIPASLVAVAVVATPLLPLAPGAAPPGPPLTLARRAGALVPVVAATAWSRAHSIYPFEPRFPPVDELWSAHFGVGLFGAFATPPLLVFVTAALVAGLAGLCVIMWLGGERGRRQGPSLVVVGLAVMAVALPAALSVPVGPLGFADRLYGLSSVGAALVLVGVGTWVARRRREAVVVGAGALVAICLVGSVVALRSWSRAGADGVALLDHLPEAAEDPAATTFVVVPVAPSRNGVVGMSSPTGGAQQAYELRWRDGTGSLFVAEAPLFEPPEEGDGTVVVDWDDVLGPG